MKAITARLSTFVLIAGIALSGAVGVSVLSGCSSTQVAPGQDAFVVEAEKDLRTAFHVVDGFLAWEAANRSTAGQEVTALADDLRVQFPAYLQSARDVLRAFKRNRTPEGRASVATWLDTVHAAMLAALRHLPAPEANAAYRATGTPTR